MFVLLSREKRRRVVVVAAAEEAVEMEGKIRHGARCMSMSLRREGRDDDCMKVVVEKRAAAPLLPMCDIIASAAMLPRLLQRENGSRAIDQ